MDEFSLLLEKFRGSLALRGKVFRSWIFEADWIIVIFINDLFLKIFYFILQFVNPILVSISYLKILWAIWSLTMTTKSLFWYIRSIILWKIFITPKPFIIRLRNIIFWSWRNWYGFFFPYITISTFLSCYYYLLSLFLINLYFC